MHQLPPFFVTKRGIDVLKQKYATIINWSRKSWIYRLWKRVTHARKQVISINRNLTKWQNLNRKTCRQNVTNLHLKNWIGHVLAGDWARKLFDDPKSRENRGSVKFAWLNFIFQWTTRAKETTSLVNPLRWQLVPRTITSDRAVYNNSSLSLSFQLVDTTSSDRND